MGLINFLKQKFAHRKEEKEKREEEKKAKEAEALKTEEEPAQEEKTEASPVVERKETPVEETKTEGVSASEAVQPEGSKETVAPSEEKPLAKEETAPSEEVKTQEAKPVEAAPAEEQKPVAEETKPVEQETVAEEVKPAETQPVEEAKPVKEAKSAEEAKPAEVVSELEPEPVVEAKEAAPETIKAEEKPAEEEKSQEEVFQETEAKQEEEPSAEEKKADVSSEQLAVEDKYVAGLDRARVGFTDRLKKLAKQNKVINQDYFDSLERILIEADVGVDLSLELIRETAEEASAKKITDPHELNDLLIDKMFVSYANKGGSFSTELTTAKEGPTVIFLCGVNGTGKTTTVAKLAHKYKERGKKVLLVAGDTFRAGAVEQLAYWAQKVSVDIIYRPNADPASLCFDAMKKAKDEHYDIVFVDTAGRLQNKKGLMDELSKMVRVIKKVIPDAPHETLLILDANTGQNGIDQAMVFKEAVPLTGIIITKMDGTSKGGIILAIRDRLALPVKFIGLGEKMDDLEEFDLDKYLYGLLVGDEEDEEENHE